MVAGLASRCGRGGQSEHPIYASSQQSNAGLPASVQPRSRSLPCWIAPRLGLRHQLDRASHAYEHMFALRLDVASPRPALREARMSGVGAQAELVKRGSPKPEVPGSSPGCPAPQMCATRRGDAARPGESRRGAPGSGCPSPRSRPRPARLRGRPSGPPRSRRGR